MIGEREQLAGDAAAMRVHVARNVNLRQRLDRKPKQAKRKKMRQKLDGSQRPAGHVVRRQIQNIRFEPQKTIGARKPENQPAAWRKQFATLAQEFPRPRHVLQSMKTAHGAVFRPGRIDHFLQAAGFQNDAAPARRLDGLKVLLQAIDHDSSLGASKLDEIPEYLPAPANAPIFAGGNTN